MSSVSHPRRPSEGLAVWVGSASLFPSQSPSSPQEKIQQCAVSPSSPQEKIQQCAVRFVREDRTAAPAPNPNPREVRKMYVF